MFTCNLLHTLLENGRFFLFKKKKIFTCHCSNTGVERTPNKSQHTKLTVEKKKILPSLLPRFELSTFRSRVRRSNQQAIPAPKLVRFSSTPRLIILTIWLYVYSNLCGNVDQLVQHGPSRRRRRFDSPVRQGIFLPESTFSADSLTVSLNPRVQSHAFASVRTLKTS